MNQQHFQDLLERIRAHRSNEANFDALQGLLEAELSGKELDPEYSRGLHELKDKQGEEYRKAKEERSSAWPEYEQFFSQFETTVLNASKRI
ncbi:MAG TPA: hypothetical protein VGB56_05010 [Flavisolibacter sp.]|jgi:hypothetical protein